MHQVNNVPVRPGNCDQPFPAAQGTVGEQLNRLISGIVDDRSDLLSWASPLDYNPGFDLQARLPGSEKHQFFLLFIRF